MEVPRGAADEVGSEARVGGKEGSGGPEVEGYVAGGAGAGDCGTGGQNRGV